MLLVIGVYVVFLSICTCEPNESRQHIEQHQQPEGGLDIDYYLEVRTKRAYLKRIIDIVLKGANFLRQGRYRARLYEKKGGLNQAVADFKSFKSTNVFNFNKERWGMSNIHTVILSKEDNVVTLEIWTYMRLPDGHRKKMRIDKIKYKE